MPEFTAHATVEAIQYTGMNIAECVQWLEDRDLYYSIHQEMQPIEGGFDGTVTFIANRKAFVVWNGVNDFCVVPSKGWVVLHHDKTISVHTDAAFNSMYSPS